ncbi:hypothetical protein BDV39DRAFT_178698 [Aspergillus sergii]|uniref:Uncharacterized protein n=1 Tax=Aspergillus sergii TaxID=1034303 RepID=A0A5N6WWS7_9EURO|nr:hypothetical protein BDV39DRAFT_178698 [Aspergillus sergii]
MLQDFLRFPSFLAFLLCCLYLLITNCPPSFVFRYHIGVATFAGAPIYNNISQPLFYI